MWIWITDIAPKYWVASALDASLVILSRAAGEFMPALHKRQASAMELTCVLSQLQCLFWNDIRLVGLFFCEFF